MPAAVIPLRAGGGCAGRLERGFEGQVDQSFGNCPQYIEARTPQWAGAAREAAARVEGATLSTEAAALVARADTLFIATAAPGQAADVSHRGGKPGFVRVDRVDGATQLTMPDFRGNFFSTTPGNIVAHPRAGLLFVDHGQALQWGMNPLHALP